MYMMATKAEHKLGDISSETPDLCWIYPEDFRQQFYSDVEVGEDEYLGEWVTGFGFVAVKFPKSTTRELTEKEHEYYSARKYI